MPGLNDAQMFSNMPSQDDIVCLERNRAVGRRGEDPTRLFLEPLGHEVWHLRVTAGQVALPSYDH